jgi:DUF4097 and DUF4098 domain-containing protein YvlB
MRADAVRIAAFALLAALGEARAQSAADGPVLCAMRVSPVIGIKIYNPTGRTRFVGWDRDSLLVRGKLARRSDFSCGGGGMGAKLNIAETSGRADLVMYLPRRGSVSVKSISADIVGENISGWFYSVSGNIRLSGHATSIEAESMNGNLDLNVSVPWIKARTGGGHLLLRGEPQDADVSTVGGTLSIATNTVLRGQFGSVTGDIHYASTPAASAIIEFSSHSGTVDLLMPAAASAAVSLSSISGSIENGFTSIRPTSASPRSMKISLGRGDAQLTVRTFKGTIRLRPDGR